MSEQEMTSLQEPHKVMICEAKTLAQRFRALGENSDLIFYFTFVILVIITVNLYRPVLLSGLLSDDWYLSSHRPILVNVFTGHWMAGGKGNFYRPFSRTII